MASNNLTVGANIAQERFLSPFNLDKPEIENTWYKIYGAQGLPQYQILKNLGMTKPVTQNHGMYFMEDRIRPVLNVAAPLTTIVAPSAGVSAQYSFVLDTTSGSNDLILGAVAPNFPQWGSSNYYYQPAIIGMCLVMPNFDNNATGTIYNITGEGTNTVTIFFRVDQTNTGLTNASYTQGTILIIESNVHAAGSDIPQAVTIGTLQDTWTMQNIWNTMKIDGDMLTNGLWTTKDSMGNAISGYRAMNQQVLDFNHALDIDNALWEGPGQNNPMRNDTAYQSMEYKTEGVLPYARRTGSQINYPVGAFNPLFFDQIDSILVQNYAPKYFMICNDNNFSNEFTNSMKDYFQFTQIDYVTKQAEDDLFSLGESGKAVKVDFQYLEKNNRVYCKNTFFRFNDPKGRGAQGYNGNNFAFFCPIGTKPDPKSPGNQIPYFGMYYKAMDGYSRLGEVGTLMGATNGQHTQSKDQNSLFYKSQIGAVHVGGINMVTARGI